MSEFSHGWRALTAATVGTMCGIFTLTNYSQGFFVSPIIDEFGWSSSQFFLSYTVLMCVGLATGPIVGTIVSRLGIRIVGMIGLIGHAIGYIAISFNNGSLVLWYLSFALLAVLGAGSLPIVWTSVLNGWFNKHRGVAIGITMAGTGLGAFFLPPIVEFFISNYGWRIAYRCVGVGALLISLPVVFTLFWENSGNSASRDAQSDAETSSWGLTRRQAMSTYRFWVLGAVLFVTVLVIAGVLSNFERIMSEQGFERSSIATMAAVMGLTVVIGRLLVGALVDRFWAPGVASCFFLLPVFGLLILINTQLTFTTGVFISILIGLAAGAELDLLAYLTSKYFGPAHYASIFGAVLAFFSVGAGMAPPLFGALAQAYEGYSTVLTGAVVFLALSIGLFLSLGRYPKQELVTDSLVEETV